MKRRSKVRPPRNRISYDEDNGTHDFYSRGPKNPIEAARDVLRRYHIARREGRVPPRGVAAARALLKNMDANKDAASEWWLAAPALPG